MTQAVVSAPTQEEFFPTSIESLEYLDVSPSTVEAIILKMLATRSSMIAGDIANELCLPYYNVVEPIIEGLREAQLLEVVKGEMQSISYVFALTGTGRERAMQFFEQSMYTGPVPVSLNYYTQSITMQSIRDIKVNRQALESAFDGLIFENEILNQIGPSVNSGQSIFLYGPPGNGKTSVSERIVRAFGGSIFIPYCVEVNGAIIRLFDEYNHRLVNPDHPHLQQPFDGRWRLIERPVIVVGGELNMQSLDLIWSEEARFYEAPFQMKANGGAFMIDDFGRQRMDPKELLNRWIVPLEKKVDYLTLHTGVKIEIPFDQLIIFSTNLDPKQLVDEAFLRRIRYKIPINNPSRENFKKIWEIVSKSKKIAYSDEIVEYFIKKHMEPHKRQLRGCIPRDILDLVIDTCKYNNEGYTINPAKLDAAAQAYFVDL